MIVSEMEGSSENGAGAKEDDTVRLEEVTDDTRAETSTTERRRFSTRSQAASRKTAEVALMTGLRSMELDEVEGNMGIHMSS